MKFTEKVLFNIAGEASYVYILSGKELIKNAKNSPFWRVFEDLKLAVNSVTRQVSFNRSKIGGKCQNSNATIWVIFKHCETESYVTLGKVMKNGDVKPEISPYV